jgi:hypothetical protein
MIEKQLNLNMNFEASFPQPSTMRKNLFLIFKIKKINKIKKQGKPTLFAKLFSNS